MNSYNRLGQAVHLTPSDPRNDSRVLRAMAACEDAGFSSVIVIGPQWQTTQARSSMLKNFRFFVLPADWFARFKFRKMTSTRLTSSPAKIVPKRSARDRELWDKISKAFGWSWRVMKPAFAARQTEKIWKQFLRDDTVSIIHVHDYGMLSAGVRLKRLTGAKLLYDAHELESEVNAIHPIESWAVRRQEKSLWGKIDAFVTVSEAIRRHYFTGNHPIDSEVVLNSPLALDRRGGAEECATIRRKLGVPDEHELFVAIGYLYPGRGIENLLRAFEGLPDNFHLAFLGSGALENDVRASSGFGKNIYLLKPVPHECLVEFISSADYGVCMIQAVSLSDQYCIPNKLLECAIAGLPVLASDLPEISRIVTEYNVGLVVENSVRGIRDGAKRIAKLDFCNFGVGRMSELQGESQSEKLKGLYRRTVRARN